MAERPHVFMNMATSLDGKITTFEHLKVRIGSAEDRRRMELLRKRADAVIIGKGTLVTDDPPLLIRDPQIAAAREAERGAPHPLNVALSSRLDFDVAGARFLHQNPAPVLVLTTEAAPAAARAAVAAVAEVEVVEATPDGRVDMRAALAALAARGVTQLLLEGGGGLNFSMLELGLVDEIFLTLCPYIIGGVTSPSMVDGRGFTKDAVRKLTLQSVTPHDSGELFLHYAVEQERASVRDSETFAGGFEIR
ncbi:MAG: RibD family protein [Alphaproteobacteria bacterium]|nr:RibD family protein [Alphaproteobacteria bacterium]